MMRMGQADRITAGVLLVLGVAMLAGGWSMDRLEVRRIHPASIPGLVPMMLGALLALCAVLLWRAARTDPDRAAGPAFVEGSWQRLGLTAALSVGYALILVGWLPFFWATALYVAAFAVIFSWPTEGEARDKAVRIAGAAGLGVAIAFGTSVLFEQVFLVRLP